MYDSPLSLESLATFLLPSPSNFIVLQPPNLQFQPVIVCNMFIIYENNLARYNQMWPQYDIVWKLLILSMMKLFSSSWEIDAYAYSSFAWMRNEKKRWNKF